MSVYEGSRHHQPVAQTIVAIHELIRAILLPRDLADVCRTIFQQLHNVLQFDAGFIEHYQPKTDTMQTIYSIDGDIEKTEPYTWDYRRSKVVAWIIANRQLIRFDDLHEDLSKRFNVENTRSFGQAEKRSRAWMSVPLLIGDAFIGVLNIQSYQAALYGEFEEALLTTVASSVALALDNAQVLAELELEVSELDIPRIPLSDDVLIVPLIGVLDRLRWEQLTQTILETLRERGCEHVLLDGSGLLTFDPDAIQAISTIVKAIELIGAKSMLIGLRPSLIEGLIRAGIHLKNIRTARDLPMGLAMLGIR